MNNIKIAELFYSVQGEGIEVGVPTVFVRTFGCNFNCKWCDSTYATFGGSYREYSNVYSLARDIQKFGHRHITITGGEPTIQADFLYEAVKYLKENKIIDYVSIETNGSIYNSDVALLIREINGATTISPKLAMLDNIEGYKASIINIAKSVEVHERPVLKFVYEENTNIDTIIDIADMVKRNVNPYVYLMPEGTRFNKEKYEKTINVCKKYNFRFSPRLHNIVWGYKKGV